MTLASVSALVSDSACCAMSKATVRYVCVCRDKPEPHVLSAILAFQGSAGRNDSTDGLLVIAGKEC